MHIFLKVLELKSELYVLGKLIIVLVNEMQCTESESGIPIPFTPQPNCLHTHSLHLFCCSHWLAGLHVTRARLAALARPCRTSISRMSSKEKITLHEREKHPPPALQTPPTEEEEEEPNRPGAPSKASSSSSSEEESESESDAESGEH